MTNGTRKPSATELPILKALWRKHPLSAKEIHDLTSEQNQWSFSSTRKTLDRMVEKEYISVSSRDGLLTFSPKLKKLATLAVFIKDFSGRILESKSPPPVSLFVDSSLLDEAELKELEKLLEAGDKPTRRR